MTNKVNETRTRGASKSSCVSAAGDENCIRDAINNPPKLLEPLDSQAREEALSQCTVQHYAKGECIIQEGECGDGLYLIASGRIEVTKLSRNGAQVHLAELQQSEHFGESSLIFHQPHATTVTALTDVQVFVMSAQVFQCMTVRYPAVNLALLQQLLVAQKNMLERMAERSKKNADRRKRGTGESE